MGKSKDLATGNSAAYVETAGDTMTGPLTVRGANGQILNVGSSSSGGTDLSVYVDANEVSFRVDPDNNESSSVMTFDVDGSEKMRVTDAGKLGVGNTSPYAKLHVEGDSYYGGVQWGTWTETMKTLHGGNQTVRIVEDWTGRWVLVGRFAANAATSVTGTWSSVRGLSTSTSQSETTAFSADFGSTYPTECRYLGATDFTNYYNTRTIDFIHGIPSGRPWELFMSNGNSTTMGSVGGTGSNKYGWTCRGAYDGFGRWSNPNYVHHRIADEGGGGMAHPSNAFRTPTTNAFNWNVTSDAKITVDGTGLSYSGQDTTLTSGFGSDDSNDNRFFDSWPTLSNNMSDANSSTQFTSAVWVLIKLASL